MDESVCHLCTGWSAGGQSLQVSLRQVCEKDKTKPRGMILVQACGEKWGPGLPEGSRGGRRMQTEEEGVGGGDKAGQAYLHSHNLAFPQSSIYPPKGAFTQQGPQQQPFKRPCGRQTGEMLAWPDISRPHPRGYQLGGQLGGQLCKVLGWLHNQGY